MSLRIESRHLGEVAVVVPQVYEDVRGFFMETFRSDVFRDLGLPGYFAQENLSRSKKGALRGLHFQWSPPMGKLMRVTLGTAYLVAVDIRKGSPTLGQWFGLEVSAENKKQVWAPAGFAGGFCALSEIVELEDKCTALYNPLGESAIRWDDPDIGIRWPITDCILSERDRNAQRLADWLRLPESDSFKFEGGNASERIHGQDG